MICRLAVGRFLHTGLFLAALVSLSSFSVASLWGSRTTNGWELLVIAYPDGRDVDVTLGGGAKTLTSTGLCSVKWRKQVASLEVDLNNLPAPAEVGWTGEQYVLWAVDSDKHITNLGVVPMKGKDAKWKLKLPARIFGLLVTAEKNAQAASPSGDVALETLLPKDPNLVVPVFRVQVPLAP